MANSFYPLTRSQQDKKYTSYDRPLKICTHPEKKQEDTADEPEDRVLVAAAGDVVEHVRPVVHNPQVSWWLGAYTGPGLQLNSFLTGKMDNRPETAFSTILTF